MTDIAVVERTAKRTRERRSTLRLEEDDRESIVNRVLTFESDDSRRRSDDIDARVQRYAKYRMWTEGKDFPWTDSSDIALPDMMEQSLRMQDTLHNAVMSQSPPLIAKDLVDNNEEKERKVDRLIEYQFFTEQEGERVLGIIAEQFINDGVFTSFIPWVKENREVHEALIFDPIPPDVEPMEYFEGLLIKKFPEQRPALRRDQDGWDWTVIENKKDLNVAFYTRKDGRVEMVYEHEVEVYNGPKAIPVAYEQLLYPPRCENLQIPSPSNPRGAPHVIMVDHPTKDEVARHIKSGFYDLADQDDLDEILNVSRDSEHQESDRLKDDLRGVESETEQSEDDAQNTVTRLVCFDIYDIDGDGKAEDVIWWVIKESKTLMRARYLTEMYPSKPPRRPFAEACLLEVEGRREGIGYLEILEGLHDAQKIILDQTIDGGTMRLVPFGFYRPHGTMRPETLRLEPGELYPLGDPSKDVNFPTIGSTNSDAFGINVVTLLRQLQEKLTMVGDIQQGRVPAGRSSALRTIGGLALLMGQGEARPERILRRFFMGLTQMWQQIHSLNEHYLPEAKKIRIAGTLKPGEDPYETIRDAQEISGLFRFEFKANVLNTSKEALQQSLMQLGQVYFNSLGFQMGTADAEGFYRWQRDLGKSLGQDPDNYIKAPSPEAMLPRIFAEEAIQEIMHGGLPEAAPAEMGGWIEHLQKLSEFANDDSFGFLNPDQVPIFETYIRKVQERAALQQRQMAQAQAAQEFSQSLGGPNPGGRPAEQPPPSLENPPVQGGELLDETLPGAGGGQ